MDKWNWKKYIQPIFNQVSIKNGSLQHRITNKKIQDKFIDDIVITFYANPMNIEDPMYGPIEAAEPELWFEQVYGDKLSVNSISELESNQFKFKPGEIFGSFSNEIDIMPLEIKFDAYQNQMISCELKLTFTNRDKSFEGTFEEHSEEAIKIKTDLEVKPLVYLDYHKLIQDKPRLEENLNSKYYNLEDIEEFDFGWKDGNMKAYKIGVK